MFGKGGMAGLMQQAQKMQENLKKAQDEIARMEVEGQAGAGMVKVTMTGKHECKRVQIDPGVMDDKEMLEDLITSAINDAARKLEASSSEKMGAMTGGMNLPPGMKLPF
ncbi:MAG: YbaB/EbfC family nucleoid-associated protein [Burkholderiales bacterium]|nr:MAG: YbaB/EbfC family nucleoid-associated protein [Burkholderiales bacterium]TAG80576.1 MAG: YbaB/EbfC family nucleoid-associated protein [Betaproteobacteria bacterium]